MNPARVATIVLAAMILTGCGDLFGGTSVEQVAWARSPDGRIHAILSETNGGATTSFGYVVELHVADHRGDEPVEAASLYGAVRSDCAYGVDLRWINPSTLAIQFMSADRIDIAPSLWMDGRAIRVVARPGRTNASAPCGGMGAAGLRSSAGDGGRVPANGTAQG